jgi:hypothetical protein
MKRVMVRYKVKADRVGENEAFIAAIKVRCDEPPVAVELDEVGAYRLFGA